jgi:hypothetical protein
MLRNFTALLVLHLFLGCVCAKVAAQEVIDRIAARVEDDVILLSEVRELSAYQKFVDGKSEGDEQVLDRLIDQWVVRSEAESSHFPRPSEAEIQKYVEQVKKTFASTAEYESRKGESGLSDRQIRAMAASQLYLGNYLDSRFRPAVQVDSKAIEEFYLSGVVERAKARGQAPPSLEASREAIQEALVQEGITAEADRWLRESRGRIHVEIVLPGGGK